MSHLTRSLSEHVAECEQGFLDRIHGIVSMDQGNHVLLAAPLSAWRGDLGGRANFTVSSDDVGLSLTQIETYRRHLNLDDMDFLLCIEGSHPSYRRHSCNHLLVYMKKAK